MNSQILNARKNELLNAQEAILNAAQENKAKLTAAQEEQFQNATNEINSIDQTLARMAAIEKGKKEVAAPSNTPFVPKTSKSGKVVVLSSEYSDAFYGSFKNRQFTNAALGEGGTQDGGYLVPSVVDGQIIPLAPLEASLRKLALVIPTTVTQKLPAQLTKSAAASKAESRSADHAFSSTNPTFTSVTLDAFMSGAYVPVTIELSQDVPALAPFLTADLSRGVNNYEEDVFVNGSGSGEPQGILNGADAGLTGHLTLDNSLDFTGVLNSSYYSAAQWLMNRKTGIAIRKIQADANQYNQYWVSVNGVDYFHGFKVNYSAAMPVYAASPLTNGAICFGSFAEAMVIGDRGGAALQIVTDNLTQLENGVIRVYGYRRTDSRVRVSEAVKVWTING